MSVHCTPNTPCLLWLLIADRNIIEEAYLYNTKHMCASWTTDVIGYAGTLSVVDSNSTLSPDRNGIPILPSTYLVIGIWTEPASWLFIPSYTHRRNSIITVILVVI